MFATKNGSLNHTNLPRRRNSKTILTDVGRDPFFHRRRAPPSERVADVGNDCTSPIFSPTKVPIFARIFDVADNRKCVPDPLLPSFYSLLGEGVGRGLGGVWEGWGGRGGVSYRSETIRLSKMAHP